MAADSEAAVIALVGSALRSIAPSKENDRRAMAFIVSWAKGERLEARGDGGAG